MAISDDLNEVATLCANAADAAIDKLIGLGPRPSDATAAATWDAQDAALKNTISTLNNLSSSISALIVIDALQKVWQKILLSQSLSKQGAVSSQVQEIRCHQEAIHLSIGYLEVSRCVLFSHN